MQVLLPFPSFTHSLACLDRARLGAQRGECARILHHLSIGGASCDAHPATRMWRGHEAALGVYMTLCIREWLSQGYVNTLEPPYQADWTPAPLYHFHAAMLPVSRIVSPPWLGDTALHASHRSMLLRRSPEHYGRLGWDDPTDLPYVWPEGLGTYVGSPVEDL